MTIGGAGGGGAIGAGFITGNSGLGSTASGFTGIILGFTELSTFGGAVETAGGNTALVLGWIVVSAGFTGGTATSGFTGTVVTPGLAGGTTSPAFGGVAALSTGFAGVTAAPGTGGTTAWPGLGVSVGEAPGAGGATTVPATGGTAGLAVSGTGNFGFDAIFCCTCSSGLTSAGLTSGATAIAPWKAVMLPGWLAC